MKIHFKAFLLVWLVLSITPSFAFNLNDSNQGLISDDGSLGDNGVEHHQKKVVEESISTASPARDAISDSGLNREHYGEKQVISNNLGVNNGAEVSSEDNELGAEIERVKSNASAQALNIEAAISECSQQIENATESREALQGEYEASVVVESNLKVKLDDFVDCIGNEEERGALEKEYQEAQYKTKAFHNRITTLDSVLKVLEKRKANYERSLNNLNSLQGLDKNNYKSVLDQFKSNMSSLENLSTNGSVISDEDFYADLYAYQVSQAWSSSKVIHKKFEDLVKNDLVVLKKDNNSYVDYIFQETKLNSAGMTIVIFMNANGDLIEITLDKFKKQYTNTVIQVDWGENNPDDIINTLKLELQKQNTNTTQNDESVTLNLLKTLGLHSPSILANMVAASIFDHIGTNLRRLSLNILLNQDHLHNLLSPITSPITDNFSLANGKKIIEEIYLSTEEIDAEIMRLAEEITSALAKTAFLEKVGEVISVVSTVIDIVTVVVVCAEIAHYTYSYIESLVQFYENKKIDTTPDIRYNGINRAI